MSIDHLPDTDSATGVPDAEVLLQEAKRRARSRRRALVAATAVALAGVVVVCLWLFNGSPTGDGGTGGAGPLGTLGATIGPSAAELAAAGQAGQHVLLSSLSCSGPSSCWAVGQTTVPDGQAVPMNGTLVERWDGSAWRAVVATGSDVTDSNVTELAGLSCPVAGWCMTFGSADQHNRGAYAAILSGLRLRQVDVPEPGNLSGVWCASTASCVAVGVAGGGAFLAERWNGTTWIAMPTSGRLGQPAALSCVSVKFCMAVGGTSGSSGWRPAAMVWNGSRWRAAGTIRGSFGHSCQGPTCSDLPVMLPRFTDVACSGPDFCVALGSEYESFAFAWDASRWKELPQLLGRGISSVSCPHDGACLAVGTTPVSSSSATSRLLALLVSPTGLKVVSPQGTTAMQQGGFGPVDCPSSSSCMALGWVWTLQSAAFAGTFDGAAWHRANFASLPPQLTAPEARSPSMGPCRGDPPRSSLPIQFVARSIRHGNTVTDFSHAYPACLIVERGQVVSVINDTGAPAQVTIGTAYVDQVAAGATLTLTPALSTRLAPGVFSLSLEDEGIGSAGFGAGVLADLWIEPTCADPATGSRCATPNPT